MTINQAIDKLTQGKELNKEQQGLKLSLIKVKVEFGGKTIIENYEQVKNVIEHGNKDGTLPL